MRILYVCTVDSMINNFLIPHIKELENRGHEVDVACSDTGLIKKLRVEDRLQVFEIQLERSPINLKNMKGLKQLIKLIKSNNYDLIHAHEPVGGVMGRLAGKLCGKKVYYTVHGFHFNENGTKLLNIVYYSIEKVMSFFTDKLFVMNSYDYKYGKKIYKKKPVIFVNGVGVDMERYSLSSLTVNDKIDLRKELGLSDNNIVVGTVAEFIKRKCYEDFLNTAKELVRSNNNYRFLLVGSGECLEGYKDRAKELGIYQYCIFTGYTTKVTPLVSIMDIFLFTSLQEGLPRAVMEAMALEKYIVASDIRGNNDLIEDGENGYLVKNGDIQTYVKRVCEYDKQKKFGEKCRDKIKNNYEQSIVIHNTLKHYPK